MPLYLFIADPGRGERWSTILPLGDRAVVIGRGAGCDLLLTGPRVPRHGLKLEAVGDALRITSLDPERGFDLDGVSHREAMVTPGSRISFGGRTLLVGDELPRHRQAESSTDDGSIGDAFRTFLETVGAPNEPAELLKRLLLGVVELFRAQRGFVLLRRQERGDLTIVASHLVDDLEELVQISGTVCNEVLKTGVPCIIESSLEDVRTQGAASLVQGNSPRTILAAPLRSGRESFGVVYVDKPWNATASAKIDEALLSTIASIAAGVLSAQATRKKLLVAHERLNVLSATLGEENEFVLGEAAASDGLRKLIAMAAPQDVSVLICGETGTGKELIARAIHRASSRRDGPFVPVHCAAIPRDLLEAELFGVAKGAFTGAAEARMGRFELAEGGTLFIDELGEIPLDAQVKLLRILQERKLTRLGETSERRLDFRLVCATNVELAAHVREGRFREDLYYRVDVLRIEVPPLRRRVSDIPVLARHFLQVMSRRLGKSLSGFTEDAMEQLLSHSWPGNVRELRNAIERAAVIAQGDLVTGANLMLRPSVQTAGPGEMRDYPDSYEEARQRFERAFFASRLDAYDGRMDRVAKATGISRSTLYRRLVSLGLAETR